ncbi:hypothetical protein [uncultured virus]|jgi:predicted  nucleic acid-binding Zn-ribbon protein|uniref:Uncharacterized protein n=1 Tax=uncultured virus TaxID=340016 RepID=A0A218MM18_9VIRU|nr:hypothetical protein [uncultured virus]|tara:strand:- start:914 stop:1093 length:180 start_codon:yes stop_codon:yes gene_type:complete
MGDDTEDLVFECDVCKEEIAPVKISKSENLYKCPSCNAVLYIEKTVEFEPDMDLDRTLH